jgi:hypothetical protein
VSLAAGGTLSINQAVTAGTGISLSTTAASTITVDADVTTTTGPFSVNSGGNLVVEGGTMSTTGDMSLTAAGSISETGTGIVSASTLTTTSAGGTTLNNANTVKTLNANNTKSGNIEFTNSGKTLSLAGISQAGGGDAIITTDGNMTVDGVLNVADSGKLNLIAASGNITQDAGGAGVITSGFLVTTSQSGTLLDGVNQVGTFTASNTGTGDIRLNNASDVLTLNGVVQTGTGDITIRNVSTDPKVRGQLVIAGDGVDTGGGNLNLTTSGNISQTAGVNANVLNVITLSDTGAVLDLSGAGNHANTLNLFSCPAAGCVQGTTQYASGNILYADSGNTNVNQVGTGGSFSGYAAGALNFTANTFIAHDATLEGLDVTFNNFTGLGTSQIGGGASGTGFLNIVAGRDIVYDGVAAGGQIGTLATPFAHDLTFTAGRNIMLGTGIYTGTGIFSIASNQDIKTANENVLASSYTSGGTVFMYGNNQIESLGSIDITGRNLLIQGGATSAANAAGNYVNVNGQSGVGQQLIAADTLNLMMSGDVTVQAGTATAVSGSGAALNAATINIGSATARTHDINIVGGTSTLDTGGNRIADATVTATGNINVYAAGDFNVTGGSVNGTATAANLVQATGNATLGGKNVVIDITGDMVVQGGTVTADVLAPLSTTQAGSSASANAIVNATLSKTITLGGNLILTGGNTLLSTKGSAVKALAVIDPGTLTINTGGDITLTGGTGLGTDATIFGSGPMTLTIGGTTGLRLVGGTGSGLFDETNARLDGNGFPINLVFTHAGTFKIIGDLTLGDAFIQSGAAIAVDSLSNLGIDSIDRTSTKRSAGFYDDKSLLSVRSSTVTTASSCK